MGFKPINTDHAIVETAISVQVARPFGAGAIDAFVKAHPTFKEELPRVQRKNPFALMLPDQTGLPPELYSPGAIFDRVNPDGTVQSRLNADTATITVNQLEYKGWDETWSKARSLLQRASGLLIAADNDIVNLVLQYIDVFEWEGSEEDYDASQLLNIDGGAVVKGSPRPLAGWHDHQGWFAPMDHGRILERIHFDAVLDDDGVSRVKVDTYLRYDLQPALLSNVVFGEQAAKLDELFGALHKRSTGLFRSKITEEMAKRIGLDD